MQVLKQNSQVEIIGANWCRFCVQSKELCELNKLNYTWVDCDIYPQKNIEIQQKYNFRTIPKIVVDGNFIGGFSELRREIQKLKEIPVKNSPLQKDSRTSEQKSYQSKQVQSLTEQNIKTFNIQLTTFEKQEKKNTEQQSLKNITQMNRQKELETHQESWYGQKKIINFQNGSYVTCYDNYDPQNQNLEFQIPLITISGFPSYIFEWKRFQQEIGNCCRIIHFVIPGMDYQDERRGQNFQGSYQQTVLMFKQFLDFFHFPKVILGFHSFGSYLAAGIQNQYPHMITSTLQLGAFGIHPHTLAAQSYLESLKKMGTSHEDLQFNQNNISQMLNSDQFRELVIQNPDKDYKFDKNTVGELVTLIKFLTSYKDGLEGIFKLIRQTPPKLRFLANGSKDEYIEQTLSEEIIYHYAIDQPKSDKIVFTQTQKNQLLQKYPELANKFNFEDIQKNFVFLMQDTGHSIHRRRGQELSNPFKIFMAVTQILNQQNLQPRL